MNVIGASLPITLDGINRQLHSIGLKINKATSTSTATSNNNNNNNKTTNSSSHQHHSFENNTRGIDVKAIQTALQESDSLISQVRKACEDFSEEPTVLQLEASVWIQRAKIEHIAGRFRQSSANYEQACKLLLQVETRRAPIFSTQDALNQAITCILYACGELVLSEQVLPSAGSTSLTASGASTTNNSISNANSGGQQQQQPGFLFGSPQEQRHSFSIFSSTFNSNNDDSSSSSPNNNNNNQNNASKNSFNNTSSSSDGKDKSSIGSRISSWFKGLPSIQPANSPAAAVAAEEQEEIRRQREAERLSKARGEAVWRWLPLDAPHRFPASQRICSLLRFMARELLKFDSIDLASHFAELSARYCLEYKFSFSFYANLYQERAIERRLEIVAPPAPSPPSPTPKGFVAIPVSLCQLFGNNDTKNNISRNDFSSAVASPVIEFCSVSTIHPTLRQQFTESMLQVCSTSLVLRQYERARISGTFALFCLENNREEKFTYSVPNDHVNISFSNSSNNNNNNNNNSPNNNNGNFVLSTAAHFMTVATMNSNFMEEIKSDENCAMIGLSIVLGVICSRPFPNFLGIVTSHIEWWENTFVSPFFQQTNRGENDNEEEDENDDDDEDEANNSEFFAWRLPIAENLKQFVTAVMNVREGRKNQNNENNDDDDSEIFVVVNKMKSIVFERNQLLGLCIHRMYHEIYSIKSERALVENVLDCVAERIEKESSKNENEGDSEESNNDQGRALSPKLGDHVRR